MNNNKTTVVFDFNIKDFQSNPFFADTPFGRPVVISVGDSINELQEINDDLLEALEDFISVFDTAALVEDDNPHIQFADVARKTFEAIAKAKGEA